ncbi:MAG TPA: hypothetical protein HA257_02175 [Candidatus Methanoperedenaceae archaeon]|nr:hypothetical protein [Candidatus Methanoperedenaceae archaeon]
MSIFKNRSLRNALGIVVLLLYAAPAALAVTEKEITQDLNCPDKEGCTMIVIDCDCPSSLKIKDEVNVMIDKGYSKSQIFEELEKEYGTGVLATPPKKGFDIVVWVALPAGLLIGAVVIWKISKKKMDENEMFEYEYNRFLEGREKHE